MEEDALFGIGRRTLFDRGILDLGPDHPLLPRRPRRARPEYAQALRRPHSGPASDQPRGDGSDMGKPRRQLRAQAHAPAGHVRRRRHPIPAGTRHRALAAPRPAHRAGMLHRHGRRGHRPRRLGISEGRGGIRPGHPADGHLPRPVPRAHARRLRVGRLGTQDELLRYLPPPLGRRARRTKIHRRPLRASPRTGSL